MQALIVRFSQKLLLLFLLIAASTSPLNAQAGVNRPRAAAPQATGKSVLNGKVVYKDNTQPLKGARVRIFTSSDAGFVAFTNDRGEFQVSNLAAGKYYVTVEGKGVAMQSGFGMRIPLPMTAIPRTEDFEEIVPKHDAEFMADGTNPVELKVKIPRGSTLSGKVLKPNGAPVAGVSVSFLSREGNSGPFNSRFSAQTDKDGAYKIEHLPEGEYLVAAATEDKNSNVDLRARMRGESQIVTYHPAATTIQQAQVVRVRPGDDVGGVNITLVARNSFAVSGTLLRQRDGTPMAGARVLLRNKDSEMGLALVPGMGQRTTFTDSEGRWSFSNVMEGSYVVTALAPAQREPRHPGEAPDREQLFRESRQRFLVAQQELLVAGADLSGVGLVISGPGAIVGRVETDNNAPLPEGLVLFVEMMGPATRPGPPLPVRVRPDGTFSFGDVQGGDVYVGFVLSPGSKYFIKSVRAIGGDPKRAPIRVTEGTEAGPVQIVILKELER